MSEPEKATSSRKIPILPLLIVLLLLAVAVFGDKGLVQVIKLNSQKAALEEEIRRLEEANQALREDIQALRSDHRRLEAIARKELGMVREDELIYQFRIREGHSAASPAGSSPEQTKGAQAAVPTAPE